MDYVICPVAGPQKKLPVFKAGKWSLLADSRIPLYRRDARSMKNFTLHFDMAEQCEKSGQGMVWRDVVSSLEVHLSSAIYVYT